MKWNTTCDEHHLSTLLLLIVILGIASILGDIFKLNQFIIPVLAFMIIAFRLSYAYFKFTERHDPPPEESDEEMELWWDIIATILYKNPKNYDDSLEIIRKLKTKYTLTQTK